MSILLSIYVLQGGRGQWAVYYNSPQSILIYFLIVGLPTLGTFIEFWLVGLLSFKRRDNLVYHHWECTLYINLSAIVLSLMYLSIYVMFTYVCNVMFTTYVEAFPQSANRP